MNTPEVAFAWYKREQFDTFRSTALDIDNFSKTFDKWKKNAEQSIAVLQKNGADVTKVILDYDDFILWCKINGRNNNADARSEFAARKLQNSYTD